MFADPLTSLDLYWIGYFRADGCINRQPRGKTAIFTQVLEEPVREFASYIGANEPRQSKNPGSYKANSSRWVASKSTAAYLLDDLGVKSDLRPDIYLSKHFWRGLLDGDGSILITMNQGRPYPYLAWSGSLVDMQACSAFIEQVLGCKGPRQSAVGSIFTTRLVGNKAKVVSDLLYSGEYSAHPDKRNRARLIEDWSPSRPNRSWKPS